MKLEIVGIHPFDRADPINQGVVSDEIVATSVGVTVRRVIYQDPETGITYTYLTNLPPSIHPGIVALLYKCRWDVEKVFDEFKNKLGETKSWASTPNAKTCQARLLCLTHHLMATRGWEMTRYADDFIIQCETQAEALAALAEGCPRPSPRGRVTSSLSIDDSSMFPDAADFVGNRHARQVRRCKEFFFVSTEITGTPFARQCAGTDQAQQRTRHVHHHQTAQFDHAELGQLLPWRRAESAQKPRPMAKDAAAQHPAKAGQAQRPGPWPGPQPVSKCLVR